MSKNTISIILVVILAVALSLGGVWLKNSYDFAQQKIDDRTNYKTIKKVEDEARAMIASYTADKLRYEQYSASSSAEQQSWAEQAKIRANTTAARYNEFVLKNSFIFKENIPEDIARELSYLE
ncbi:hypothetical protein IJI70_03275 [Candidatus Saccharibacteria bacterium]|nr:hypothetical protein [Candidatus Saccharibacteria bacterium]